VPDVFEMMRSRIKERGARGLAGIGRSFRVMDDNNSGMLSTEEFFKALKDYRIT
jgi:Ca2+-binding EF-hand superfamily protein